MAEANFKEGYNCSQAVFAAFSKEVGLPRQTALQLASGFGGGIGRMREVCGAFSGADIGIVKYHFELGAGNAFDWA